MLWINFLHLYQPANADGHVIEEATENSYQRLVAVLKKNPEIKFTLNISGCLLLRLEELGFNNLINNLSELINKGQIELVGTVAYHPLLPLIPEDEIISQIKGNEAILKKYFGKNFKANGFFMPEMAVSAKVCRLVKKLGYKWIIVDEIALAGKLNKVDFTKIYQDISGLKVVFRSRANSNCYVPERIGEMLDKKKDDLVITATDGELYGLRHEDPGKVFEKVLKRKTLETKTISEFIKNKKTVKVELKNCSWESTEKELKQNKPYQLWNDKKNVLHKKLWELAELSYNVLERNKKDDNYDWARWHFVRGLASCTFWWASGKDFRNVFGPHAWGPDEVERGTNELIRAIRSLDDVTTRQTKIEAEKLYIKIKKIIWDRHWRYYWKPIKN